MLFPQDPRLAVETPVGTIRSPAAEKKPRLAQARQEEHLAAARVFEVQHQTSARKQQDTTSTLW